MGGAESLEKLKELTPVQLKQAGLSDLQCRKLQDRMA